VLKGTRKYWFIAIICGIIASLLFYQYLQELKNRYTPNDLVQIVKARSVIAADTLIGNDRIEVTKIPSKYVHSETIKDPKDVVGKIAVTDIAAGEPILKSKVVTPGDKNTRFSYGINNWIRAVSVAVDNVSGVSGYIEAGDKVDVIATVDIPVKDTQGRENLTPFCIFSAQNIEVLAVGSKGLVNNKNTQEVKTVTLAMPVDQVQSVVLASEKGRIRLILRSPVDKSENELPPFTLKDYLQ